MTDADLRRIIATSSVSSAFEQSHVSQPPPSSGPGRLTIPFVQPLDDAWWMRLASNPLAQHVGTSLFVGLCVLTLLIYKRPSLILKAKDDTRVAVLQWNWIWGIVLTATLLVLTLPFLWRDYSKRGS